MHSFESSLSPSQKKSEYKYKCLGFPCFSFIIVKCKTHKRKGYAKLGGARTHSSIVVLFWWTGTIGKERQDNLYSKANMRNVSFDCLPDVAVLLVSVRVSGQKPGYNA